MEHRFLSSSSYLNVRQGKKSLTLSKKSNHKKRLQFVHSFPLSGNTVKIKHIQTASRLSRSIDCQGT